MIESLRNAPTDAWIALFGVLAGSLLTTFGVWLTNKANARQARLRFAHEERMHRDRIAKERLEELYVLVSHWLHGLFANYMNLAYVMQGEFDYNHYLDLTIRNKADHAFDFSRIEMIIGVYGTDLAPAYDRVIACRNEANKIAADHKRAYQRGEPGDPFLTSFTAAQASIDRAGEDLKKATAEAARRA